MGFLGKIKGLFNRQQEEDENVYRPDWEEERLKRDNIDMHDKIQREHYVKACLEQMSEASKELDALGGEYNLVTSYLTDMEEIEALPEKERETLNGIAGKLLTMEQEGEKYRGKKNRMTDVDYYRLREQEAEVQEGIGKLKECEEYGEKVKHDLKRLDMERHAYEFRRQELETILNNLRGISVIFLTAFVLCIVMLLVLQFGFQMDTKLGYLLAGAAVALAVTVSWVKYTNGDSELRQIEIDINRLILLQNKVKIRYVNNRNLRDYLCMKYSTENAASLDRLWKKYQKEKEERREYAEAESKAEYYRKQLVHELARYRISSPERWLGHPAALLDKREMVEIRHDLILRRQSLRKQMDYNQDISETARREIMDVAEKYPEYAVEIQEMVDHYKAD